MAVDTACAGSLTALHVACQGLRAGETPLAIAGGINIMATPALVVALDAAGATAEDGRSKAFDAAADGYGRGEGAGVMVLKRLADAIRDGDPVRAVIRASGVFQDGRSDGHDGPERRRTGGHAAPRLRPRGRSIRARSTTSRRTAPARRSATSPRRRRSPRCSASTGPPRTRCSVGSLKPNIGHVEAASGIAGVDQGRAGDGARDDPAPARTKRSTRRSSWQRSGLRLVAEATPWPQNEGPRRAGVSSYGVGGTIAHMIIERPQTNGAAHATPAPVEDRLRVFPLSASSETGLQGLAGVVADWTRTETDASLEAIAHTLAQRRSHLTSRAAIVARSRDDLTELLDDARERRAFAADRHRTGAEHDPRRGLGVLRPRRALERAWAGSSSSTSPRSQA